MKNNNKRTGYALDAMEQAKRIYVAFQWQKLYTLFWFIVAVIEFLIIVL